MGQPWRALHPRIRGERSCGSHLRSLARRSKTLETPSGSLAIYLSDYVYVDTELPTRILTEDALREDWKPIPESPPVPSFTEAVEKFKETLDPEGLERLEESLATEAGRAALAKSIGCRPYSYDDELGLDYEVISRPEPAPMDILDANDRIVSEVMFPNRGQGFLGKFTHSNSWWWASTEHDLVRTLMSKLAADCTAGRRVYYEGLGMQTVLGTVPRRERAVDSKDPFPGDSDLIPDGRSKVSLKRPYACVRLAAKLLPEGHTYKDRLAKTKELMQLSDEELTGLGADF